MLNDILKYIGNKRKPNHFNTWFKQISTNYYQINKRVSELKTKSLWTQINIKRRKFVWFPKKQPSIMHQTPIQCPLFQINKTRLKTRMCRTNWFSREITFLWNNFSFYYRTFSFRDTLLTFIFLVYPNHLSWYLTYNECLIMSRNICIIFTLEWRCPENYNSIC